MGNGGGYLILTYSEKSRCCQISTWSSTYRSLTLLSGMLRRLRSYSEQTATHFNDLGEAKRLVVDHLRNYPTTRFGYVCPFAAARLVMLHVLRDVRASEAIDQIVDTYLCLPPEDNRTPCTSNHSEDVDSIWSEM